MVENPIRGAATKSHCLKLYANRQTDDVFQRNAAVLELGANVEVAGTDFIEQTDALGIFVAVAGDVPCDVLAECYVQAELGGH